LGKNTEKIFTNQESPKFLKNEIPIVKNIDSPHFKNMNEP